MGRGIPSWQAKWRSGGTGTFQRKKYQIFGVPSILQCNNGPGFVANVVKKMCEKLHITIKYGSVYHSQSQGRVERMNQTLKGKLSKICAQIGLNWVTVLPIALMAIRGSTNRGTKLTPHKMVTGRKMP